MWMTNETPQDAARRRSYLYERYRNREETIAICVFSGLLILVIGWFAL